MREKGENMKKFIMNVIAVLTAVFLVTGLYMPAQVQAANNEPETSYEYEDGFESGYHEGWKQGFHDGEEFGYESGYEAGYEAGCEDGYNAGEDSTIGFFVEYYGLDEGIEESLRANEYWRRTIEEEGENVDSDYMEFYWEELPEYPK